MPVDAPLDIATTLRRVRRTMLVLSSVGAIGLWVSRDANWAGSFLLGAAVSFLSLRFYERLSYALETPESASSQGSTKRLFLRLFLLGASGFVIIKLLSVVWIAAIAGLFVAAVAVILALLIELLYARA